MLISTQAFLFPFNFGKISGVPTQTRAREPSGLWACVSIPKTALQQINKQASLSCQ